MLLSRKGWPTSLASYELGEPVGYSKHTNEASVFKATVKISGEDIAVKICHLDDLWEDRGVRFRRILDELRTELSLDCPQLVRSFNAFVEGPKLYVLMPIMDRGSASNLLQTTHPNGLDDGSTFHILKEALKGLEHLHHQCLIHRAVRADNILLGGDSTVKLAGLDMCLRRPECSPYIHDFEEAVENIPWMAPEYLSQDIYGYNEKVDCYSLGITAIELVTGSNPYRDMPTPQIFLLKLQGVMPIAPASHKSRLFQQFLQDCLIFDPMDRPGASKLLSHSIFRQVRRASGILKKTLQTVPSLVTVAAQVSQTHHQADLDYADTELPLGEYSRRPFPQLLAPGLRLARRPGALLPAASSAPADYRDVQRVAEAGGDGASDTETSDSLSSRFSSRVGSFDLVDAQPSVVSALSRPHRPRRQRRHSEPTTGRELGPSSSPVPLDTSFDRTQSVITERGSTTTSPQKPGLRTWGPSRTGGGQQQQPLPPQPGLQRMASEGSGLAGPSLELLGHSLSFEPCDRPCDHKDCLGLVSPSNSDMSVYSSTTTESPHSQSFQDDSPLSLSSRARSTKNAFAEDIGRARAHSPLALQAALDAAVGAGSLLLRQSPPPFALPPGTGGASSADGALAKATPVVALDAKLVQPGVGRGAEGSRLGTTWEGAGEMRSNASSTSLWSDDHHSTTSMRSDETIDASAGASAVAPSPGSSRRFALLQQQHRNASALSGLSAFSTASDDTVIPDRRRSSSNSWGEVRGRSFSHGAGALGGWSNRPRSVSQSPAVSAHPPRGDPAADLVDPGRDAATATAIPEPAWATSDV